MDADAYPHGTQNHRQSCDPVNKSAFAPKEYKTAGPQYIYAHWFRLAHRRQKSDRCHSIGLTLVHHVFPWQSRSSLGLYRYSLLARHAWQPEVYVQILSLHKPSHPQNRIARVLRSQHRSIGSHLAKSSETSNVPAEFDLSVAMWFHLLHCLILGERVKKFARW